ncbi:MAG: SDR family oxidoreductase [Blastocatellia bacterium]|nr:SDR family oxidoreductase [Blastocatellia bacterium]
MLKVMNIQDSVILITGASSGIGAETAKELAAQGARVVLAARRESELNALAREIERQGGKALPIQVDVSRYDDIQRMVETTLTNFGRIDVLVNNAGIGGGKYLSDATDDEIERTIQVNLVGPARCARAVIPQMKRQKSGVIVNIGSVAGEIAVSPVYSATKFGLRGFTDGLRRELRSDGIDVVLIAPGFIKTPMTEGLKVNMPGPEVVARAIIRAIERPCRKIIVPWYYAPLAWLSKLLPWVADMILGSASAKQRYSDRKKD